MCRLIDKQDGVRLLWSLLKSPNTEVSTVCVCVHNHLAVRKALTHDAGTGMCCMGHMSMH